jgi:hypothetical protein
LQRPVDALLFLSGREMIGIARRVLRRLMRR